MKYIFTSIINNYISDYRELFFEVTYRKFHRSIGYPIGTLFPGNLVETQTLDKKGIAYVDELTVISFTGQSLIAEQNNCFADTFHWYFFRIKNKERCFPSFFVPMMPTRFLSSKAP